MCVEKCPATPDYYGDPHIGRCVFFCTEGTYAENDTRQCLQQCPDNTYADNLTRKCVEHCPHTTQGTFKDDTTWKCVRVCPDGYWAENSTGRCVDDCPKHANGTETYEDDISKFCVAQCPYPFFGRNDTHDCVETCSDTLDQYGHPEQRVCVSHDDCYGVLSRVYYADSVSRKCVQTCPQTLWADQSPHFKCVTDCFPLTEFQYRNMHDQTCTSLCPSDPEQYADDVSGNCVPNCPDGSYAYSTTGVRECVSECGSYGLFADDSTNRCVSVCPIQPFTYADSVLDKCVSSCEPSLLFADNKTQTCVSQCPAQWELWGETDTYTCVQLCPDNYFADPLDNRQCKLSCTSPRFADKFTSQCVEHCSQIRKFYYEDLSTGVGICVEECPGESYGYNADQTCKTQNVNLSSSCPGTFYADRDSQQCVEKCPNGTYADDGTKYCETTCFGGEYADIATRTCRSVCSDNYFAMIISPSDYQCIQFCPDNYFAENSSDSCVAGCSSLLALQSTNTCENYCPEPFFAKADENQCKTDCSPMFADIDTRTCLSQCNSPDFGNPLNMKCERICPDGYFGRQNGRICSLTCLDGTYADPSTRKCVTECPQYPLLFADGDLDKCVQKCSSGFGYQPDRTCRATCPNATINSQNLVFLADSFNSRCVLRCINQEISFADYLNNECTALCPSGYFASNWTKQCLETCPSVPNDTFAETTSRTCLEQCPNGMFGNAGNLSCVSDCVLPLYADPTSKLCVEFCPDGYYGQNSTAECTQNCLANTYADPKSHMCVTECPLAHDLFKHDQDWTCVADCPTNFYADDTERKCKLICETPGMYAYNVTRQCVRECPVPYRGYDVNSTCILTCPYLYFYNITRNVCTKCPDECLVCTGPNSCLECAGGYNLFNGICGVSCQPNNGVITYADPSGVCVSVCPFSYFGDDSSYSCTQTCPNKQYGSNDTQLCEDCPATCALCSSPTNCSVCEADATLAIDNMCYRDCNSTHKYYYLNECLNVCPNGTYLTYTSVHCGACSTNCATCENTATNCLSCNGKYFFQNACLAECPTDYFGNSSFQCQPCSSTNNSTCNEPLKFTTEVVVEDFVYTVLLKFNQQVSIQKQIEDLLKIQLQVQRRLLSLTDLINNGIGYTYTILADGTIKLSLIIDENLDNPQFTVQITDPTAIQSLSNGGLLQNAETYIELDKVLYYTPEQSTQAQTNIASRFTVIFVLLLYALSFFWTDAVVKPIQFLQLAMFHACIDAPIPPSVYYYLTELKRSLFQFMPNFIDPHFDSSYIYHEGANLKIIDTFGDYNFLRNMGQIFFFLVMFGCLWIVFFFLSNKKLIENKLWHNMWSDIFTRRFKFMALNDVFSLFYLPILWFGFNQMRDLSASSSYLVGNAIATFLFVIMAICLPIGLFLAWSKKEASIFQQQFSFLCKRLKNQESTNEIYEAQERLSEEQLKDAKQNSSDSRLPLSVMASHNLKHQLETMITYTYLTICVIWMVALYESVVAQLVMLLLTHCLYLAYLLVYRPYINIINTIVVPLMVIPLILIQSYFWYFHSNSESMFATTKTEIAQTLLIIVSVFYMLLILWTIWRCIWDFMDSWTYFKKTEFYLVYGDNDYEVEEQKSQIYEKYEKKVEANEQGLGDTVVEKIFKEVNDQGESVIRVKKKVLKKKQKLVGRKKKLPQQQQQIISQEAENGQFLKKSNRNMNMSSSLSYEDEDYVRVNKVSPFEYDKLYDGEKKDTQSKVKKAVIDDDLRDDIDDDYAEVNQKAELKKSAINKASNKKEAPPNNKVILEVQQDEESVHDLEAVLREEEEPPKEKEKEEDMPFEFISDLADPLEEAPEKPQQTPEKSHQKAQIPSKDMEKDNSLPESGVKEQLKEAKQKEKVPEDNFLGLQELLEEEEKRKSNKLMFLFDEEED